VQLEVLGARGARADGERGAEQQEPERISRHGSVVVSPVAEGRALGALPARLPVGTVMSVPTAPIV
jgi:hypothetical protein